MTWECKDLKNILKKRSYIFTVAFHHFIVHVSKIYVHVDDIITFQSLRFRIECEVYMFCLKKIAVSSCVY